LPGQSVRQVLKSLDQQASLGWFKQDVYYFIICMDLSDSFVIGSIQTIQTLSW